MQNNYIDNINNDNNNKNNINNNNININNNNINSSLKGHDILGEVEYYQPVAFSSILYNFHGSQDFSCRT